MELAVTTLRGEAKVWWQRQRLRFRGDPPIPWEWFETSFRDQYMGPIQMAGLRRQFEQLTQGSLSVRQSSDEFIRLSKYAPDLISTDSITVDRFIGGLRPELASRVDIGIAGDLVAVVQLAERQERRVKREREEHAARVAKQRPNKAVRVGPQITPSAPQRPWCRKCQKPHLESECQRVTGGCYECGMPGHWKIECPKLTDAPPRSSCRISFFLGE